MNFYRKHKKSISHFMKFMIVGAVNFGVDLGIFTILHAVLGIDTVPSNIVSYSCGVINSFLLNMFWTFRIRLRFFSVYTIKPGRIFKKGLRIRFFSIPFLKFIFVNLISWGVNTLTMYILVDLYKIFFVYAKVLATFFSFIVNFAGSKLLVFREKNAETAEQDIK